MAGEDDGEIKDDDEEDDEDEEEGVTYVI